MSQSSRGYSADDLEEEPSLTPSGAEERGSDSLRSPAFQEAAVEPGPPAMPEPVQRDFVTPMAGALGNFEAGPAQEAPAAPDIAPPARELSGNSSPEIGQAIQNLGQGPEPLAMPRAGSGFEDAWIHETERRQRESERQQSGIHAYLASKGVQTQILPDGTHAIATDETGAPLWKAAVSAPYQDPETGRWLVKSRDQRGVLQDVDLLSTKGIVHTDQKTGARYIIGQNNQPIDLNSPDPAVISRNQTAAVRSDLYAREQLANQQVAKIQAGMADAQATVRTMDAMNGAPPVLGSRPKSVAALKNFIKTNTQGMESGILTEDQQAEYKDAQANLERHYQDFPEHRLAEDAVTGAKAQIAQIKQAYLEDRDRRLALRLNPHSTAATAALLPTVQGNAAPGTVEAAQVDQDTAQAAAQGRTTLSLAMPGVLQRMKASGVQFVGKGDQQRPIDEAIRDALNPPKRQPPAPAPAPEAPGPSATKNFFGTLINSSAITGDEIGEAVGRSLSYMSGGSMGGALIKGALMGPAAGDAINPGLRTLGEGITHDTQQDILHRDELQTGKYTPGNPYAPTAPGNTPGEAMVNPKRTGDLVTGAARAVPDAALLALAPYGAIATMTGVGAMKGGDKAVSDAITRGDANPEDARMGAMAKSGGTSALIAAFYALTGGVVGKVMPAVANPLARALTAAGITAPVLAAVDAGATKLAGGNAVPQTPDEWGQRLAMLVFFTGHAGFGEYGRPKQVEQVLNAAQTAPERIQLAKAQIAALNGARPLVEGQGDEVTLAKLNADQEAAKKFLDAQNPRLVEKIRVRMQQAAEKAKAGADQSGETAPPQLESAAQGDASTSGKSPDSSPEPALNSPAGQAKAFSDTLKAKDELAPEIKAAQDAGTVSAPLLAENDVHGADAHQVEQRATAEIPEGIRNRIAAVLGADGPANEAHFAQDPDHGFAAAHVGKELRDTYTTPEQQAALERIGQGLGDKAPVAEYVADQHVGMLAGRDLLAIATGRGEVPPERVAELGRLGLVEPGADGTPHVTHDALPILPKGLTAKLAQAHDRFRVLSLHGEKLEGAAAMVRNGQAQLETALHARATAAAEQAAAKPYHVQVEFTDHKGEAQERVIRGKFHSDEQALAHATVVAEKRGMKVTHAEVTTPEKEEARRDQPANEGAPGYRHVQSPESQEYIAKGGWKLHLTVDPKNYAAVDAWLNKNHPGQYKLLAGGDAGKKDFTIYVGEHGKAKELAAKIQREIGGKLADNKAGTDDAMFTEKVSARFDPREHSYYGRNGLPYDEAAKEAEAQVGYANDKPDDLAQWKQILANHEARIRRELTDKYGARFDSSAADPLARTKVSYRDLTKEESDSLPADQRAAIKEVGREFQRNAGLFKQFGITEIQPARAEGEASGIATSEGRLSVGRLSVDAEKVLEQKRIVQERGGDPTKWVRRALIEEVVHQATIKGLGAKWRTKLEAAWNDPAMTDEMRSEVAKQAGEKYEGFDDLDPHQKAAELVRMVVQGEWKGSITEQVFNIIRDLHAYLTGLKVEASPLLQEAIEQTKAALTEARRRVVEQRRTNRATENTRGTPEQSPTLGPIPIEPDVKSEVQRDDVPSPEPATPAPEAQAALFEQAAKQGVRADYSGYKGTLERDPEGRAVLVTDDGTRVEIPAEGQRIGDGGVTLRDPVVDVLPNGGVKLNGKPYQFVRSNIGADGTLESVTIKNAQGREQTVDNPRQAMTIALEMSNATERKPVSARAKQDREQGTLFASRAKPEEPLIRESRLNGLHNLAATGADDVGAKARFYGSTPEEVAYVESLVAQTHGKADNMFFTADRTKKARAAAQKVRDSLGQAAPDESLSAARAKTPAQKEAERLAKLRETRAGFAAEQRGDAAPAKPEQFRQGSLNGLAMSAGASAIKTATDLGASPRELAYLDSLLKQMGNRADRHVTTAMQAKALREADKGTVPAPEPHVLTKPEGRSVINAYHHLAQKTGFPAVSIAELADQSGIPLDRLKQQLLRSQKAGSVVLSTGDWSLSSDKVRSGAIEQPGQRPMLQVRFLNDAGGMAAAKAKSPAETAFREEIEARAKEMKKQVSELEGNAGRLDDASDDDLSSILGKSQHALSQIERTTADARFSARQRLTKPIVDASKSATDSLSGALREAGVAVDKDEPRHSIISKAERYMSSIRGLVKAASLPIKEATVVPPARKSQTVRVVTMKDNRGRTAMDIYAVNDATDKMPGFDVPYANTVPWRALAVTGMERAEALGSEVRDAFTKTRDTGQLGDVRIPLTWDSTEARAKLGGNVEGLDIRKLNWPEAAKALGESGDTQEAHVVADKLRGRGYQIRSLNRDGNDYPLTHDSTLTFDGSKFYGSTYLRNGELSVLHGAKEVPGWGNPELAGKIEEAAAKDKAAFDAISPQTKAIDEAMNASASSPVVEALQRRAANIRDSAQHAIAERREVAEYLRNEAEMPERMRGDRLGAKIMIERRATAQRVAEKTALWSDLIEKKYGSVVSKLARFWKGVATDDESFVFPKSTARDPDLIAQQMSIPGHEMTATEKRDEITFHTAQGELSITGTSSDKPEIYAASAGSKGKKQGGGAQLYQAALTWAHNNGKKIYPSNALTPINKFVRRTSNMLSSALRFGTTKHMTPDREQGVKWKNGSDSYNVGQLALREMEQVFKAVSDLQNLTFDFDTAKVRDAEGKEVTPADLEQQLREDKESSFDRGIGRSTAQRAIITASALRELESSEAAGDGRGLEGRGPRVSDEQGSVLYASKANADPVSARKEAAPDDTGALQSSKALTALHDKIAEKLIPAKQELRAAGSKREIAQDYDAAETGANIGGDQAGNMIRLDFARPKPANESPGQRKAREAAQTADREAMPYVIENGIKPLAQQRADVLASSDPKLIKSELPKVDRAIANFTRLDKLRFNHDRLMGLNMRQLKGAGVSVGEVQDYITRKLELPDATKDAEPSPMFPMGNGAAGSPRYFTKGRSFATLSEAVRAGYKPVSTDIAKLDQHRIEAGRNMIEQRQFFEKLKKTPSPTDGKPIIGEMIQRPLANGETEATVPHGYTTVTMAGRPFVVHKQFADLFSNLFGQSAIRSTIAGRALLKLAAAGKHGTLVFDTFHVGRLLYKMASGIGNLSTAVGEGSPIKMRDGKPSFGYHAGRTLLEYSDSDLGRAQAAGDITAKEAAFARKYRAQFDELVKSGLNIGKVSDNLMEQAGLHIPGVSTANKWIFGKLSRGAMVQTALKFYDRNLSRSGMSREQAARRTATEMNEYFGNLQNQGIFKSKTLQDVARLVFLAPNWTESQARYEARSYGQVGASAVDAARGNGVRVGNATRAMATGFVALLAANQVANYLSRGQSTFQNEEDGHKLDAWVPGGKRGFWFNPFEIAGEYAHAAMKYAAQHENPVDIATHIASNKLSPLGRGVKEAATGRDSSGRHFLNDTDRFRGAAVDALPSPMPLGGFFEKDPRSPTGYRITRAPGAFQKQLMQSAGAKVTAAQSPRTQMFAIAHDFRPDGQYVDSAGEYTELRRALDNDQPDAAQSEVQWLLGRGKTLKQIGEALGIKAGGISKEQFTGSADRGQSMLATLTPEQRKVYDQAQRDHVENAKKFRALVTTPEFQQSVAGSKTPAVDKSATSEFDQLPLPQAIDRFKKSMNDPAISPETRRQWRAILQRKHAQVGQLKAA